jgi:predicted Fe-Mo cluster-binding NifX family protein
MKIAIASDDQIKIAPHLGRTNGFVVVDLEDGKVKSQEYRINDFTGHRRGLKEHGHEPGRHGPILSALKDCKVIISHGMGRRLISDLNVAGIDTYLTDEEDISRAIDLYIEGNLDNKPELGCKHN